MATDLVPVTSPDRDTGRAVVWALVQRFVDSLQSQSTRTNYRSDLRMWVDWPGLAGLNPFDTGPYGDIGPHLVREWETMLQARGNAPGTRARRLAALSSWYDWLEEGNYVERNPVRLIRSNRPKFRAPGTHGIALTRAQQLDLLRVADAHSLRMAALVAVMLCTGARIAEVLNLTEADRDVDRGQPVLRLATKGGGHRTPVLAPFAYTRLTRYLDSRPDRPDRLPALTVGARAPRRLFVTGPGRAWDKRHTDRLLAHLGELLGQPVPHLCWHDLRRSFISDQLAAGVPLDVVQGYVGHARPETTLGYVRRTSVEQMRFDVFAALDQLDPTHSEGTPS